MRYTDHGIRFDTTGRMVGRHLGGAVAAFLIGNEMFGVVSEDGRTISFLRATSELTETERAELADNQIRLWNIFKEGKDGKGGS